MQPAPIKTLDPTRKCQSCGGPISKLAGRVCRACYTIKSLDPKSLRRKTVASKYYKPAAARSRARARPAADDGLIEVLYL